MHVRKSVVEACHCFSCATQAQIGRNLIGTWGRAVSEHHGPPWAIARIGVNSGVFILCAHRSGRREIKVQKQWFSYLAATQRTLFGR